jgi:CRP-like cAMP-binding protein
MTTYGHTIDLRRLRLFREMTEEELNRIFDHLERAEASAGTVILEGGQPGSTLFFIERGAVRVKNLVQGQTVVLATLGPHEHFGDMAVIDGKGSSATVETIEPSVFWCLSRPHFLHLIEDEREIGRKFWRALAEILSERLRFTNKTLNDYMRINQTLTENKTFRDFYKMCHS